MTVASPVATNAGATSNPVAGSKGLMRSAAGLIGMVVAVGCACPAWGYIDIQPTLGRIVNEARVVFVARVEKVSREKRAIIYSHAQDVKGTWARGPRVRHQ